MGNYYEGEIFICLKKELPENYIKLFCAMSRNDAIPSEFYEEDFFKTEGWDSLKYYFGYWYIRESDNNRSIYVLYDGDQSEYSGLFLKGFFINVSICQKQYENYMELFIKFVKPYMHCDTPNSLGVVKDEDGTYGKHFFVDNKEFEKEVKRRLPICGDCSMFLPEYLCPEYGLCFEAFHRGKNSCIGKHLGRVLLAGIVIAWLYLILRGFHNGLLGYLF